MKNLKIIAVSLAALVFLSGLSLCLFPHIQSIVKKNQMEEVSQEFLQEHSITDAPPTDSSVSNELASPIVHEKLWHDMSAYNLQLWRDRQAGLNGSRAYSKPSFILSDYGLEREIFGVISIASLELEMPLYLGASTANMANGAAHMSQTSLPIGGANTNCVIAGHCGHNGAAYFRYITKLLPGDKVIITNLWETMTYTVTETKIIWPNEVDEVLIQKDRDMITLLTCYPYASGGRQRYLVFCDRATDE